MVDLFEGLKMPREKPRRPTEPIKREALVEDGCRYWLKRAWGAGPLILWAMCNPSDADATRDDPTMLRVMEFSLRWGFGSCVVVNLVPVISSTPAAAVNWAKEVRRSDFYKYQNPEWTDYVENLGHCLDMIKAATTHVAAWGNILPPDFARDWLQSIAESDDEFGGIEDDRQPVEWVCLGMTQSGAPKHPLARGKHRVPADFRAVPFKMP